MTIRECRQCGILYKLTIKKQLFPVQSELITHLTQQGPRRDYAIQAPTGSGKTLAFLVPTITKILQRAIPYIRIMFGSVYESSLDTIKGLLRIINLIFNKLEIIR